MGLDRFRVRTRIYAGFGLLVFVACVLAGFAVWQMQGVGREAGAMDALAGNITRVLQTARGLETMRRAQTDFRTDGAAAAMQEFAGAKTKALELLDASGKATLSAERRQVYAGVSASLNEYDGLMQQFVQLSKNAADARVKLFAGGDAMTAATDKLVAAARAQPDDQVAGDAADAIERTILLVRVANWRYLATLDKGGPALFAANVQKASAALALLAPVKRPEVQALVGPVEDALSAYGAAFASYSAIAPKMAALFDEQMRPRMVAMTQQLETAVTSLSNDFAASNEATARTIASTTLAQELLAAAGLLIGIGLAFVIGRGIVRPLAGMTAVMAKLAAGDHAVDVPARDNVDEIGDMARAMEVFKQHAFEAERLAAEQSAARAAKERRQAVLEKHTETFGSSISEVMAALARSAEGMRQAAEAMSEAAGAVHEEATGTSEGAAKSSRDLTAVAAAVEEMTTSVAEIARQVASAAEVATQAVQRADASRGTMQGLSEATVRIGDVVHLISNIANQTNLLALNATIEAARAGEAGKGFAVVAGEVKVLAAQTAKATDEIGSQIETVRSATNDAVTAMADISTIIGRMNEVAAAISAAVEEQSATTREIASSVQAVSGATAGTAQAMTHVVSVADKAGDASRDVLTGATDIGKGAQTLRETVDQFLMAVHE